MFSICFFVILSEDTLDSMIPSYFCRPAMSFGMLVRLDHRHVHVLGAQGGGEGLGLVAALLGEEHLGPPAHHDGADRAVVLLDGVAVHLDRRLVDVDAALLERLPVRVDVLARD